MIEAFVTASGTIYTAIDVVQSDIIDSRHERPVYGSTQNAIRMMTFQERRCMFTFKTPASDIRGGLNGSISYRNDSYEAKIISVTKREEIFEIVAEGNRIQKIE